MAPGPGCSTTWPCSTCSRTPAWQPWSRRRKAPRSSTSTRPGRPSPGRGATPSCPGLPTRPVRWIVDDAAAFVAREVRRGRRYDGVVLDPPSYGHGPRGRGWRLEDDLAPLLLRLRSWSTPEGVRAPDRPHPGLRPRTTRGRACGAVRGRGRRHRSGCAEVTARTGATLDLGAFARWPGRDDGCHAAHRRNARPHEHRQSPGEGRRRAARPPRSGPDGSDDRRRRARGAPGDRIGAGIDEAFVCVPLLQGADARAALDRLTEAGVRITTTSPTVFEKLAFGERAEGIVAVVRVPSLVLDDLQPAGGSPRRRARRRREAGQPRGGPAQRRWGRSGCPDRGRCPHGPVQPERHPRQRGHGLRGADRRGAGRRGHRLAARARHPDRRDTRRRAELPTPTPICAARSRSRSAARRRVSRSSGREPGSRPSVCRCSGSPTASTSR